MFSFLAPIGSSAGTVNHNLNLGNILADYLHGVLQSGSADNGSTVLVVVHHGYVECLLQSVLDIEALRGFDILQVNTAKGGGDTLYSLAELLRILLGYLDIENVDTTINLKQQSLTFHYRLAAQGTNVAQSQHSCTVRDNCYQITLVGVFVSIVGVLLNFQTRICYSWRVG